MVKPRGDGGRRLDWEGIGKTLHDLGVSGPLAAWTVVGIAFVFKIPEIVKEFLAFVSAERRASKERELALYERDRAKLARDRWKALEARDATDR